MSFDIVKSNDLVIWYCEILFQITPCSFLPAPTNDYFIILRYLIIYPSHFFMSFMDKNQSEKNIPGKNPAT